MALVAYSDSETSDVEASPVPAAGTKQNKASTAAPGFQKTESRKIKVDLPSLQPEIQNAEPERPSKRAKVGGGGFNSLLPAPKRTAERNGIGRGVNLKTSSEAAFIREAPKANHAGTEMDDPSASDDINKYAAGGHDERAFASAASTEPRIVGKATRFKPLSVQAGQKKKSKRMPATPPPVVDQSKVTNVNGNSSELDATTVAHGANDGNLPPTKPKRSLFSVPTVDEKPSDEPKGEQGEYESMIENGLQSNDSLINEPASKSYQPHAVPATAGNSDSLQALTAGMELTSAQRRQLFGRHCKDGKKGVQFAHFDMEAEYASNEALRQSGETVEHRAVKAIAPGKHSLQQLVNNARSQQDNLEDKWAEGRRERGEGSSRYGWGR